MKVWVGILTCFVVAGLWTQVLGQEKMPKSWAGKWKGTLTNFPAREGAKPIAVTRELGAFPTKDGACATWRTTYSEDGTIRQVKDYKLCRGSGASDLFLDEGNGIRLKVQWLGDMLISPFKYDDLILISSMRLRGDVLEEEILTVADNPMVKGIVPLKARGIQRVTLRRVR